MSDIENPKSVAWYEPEYGGVHNVWVAGDTLYMGAYNAGFRAFDISGELRGDLRAQGREIVHVNTADMDGNVQNAAMTWGVVVKDGLAYVNDNNNGLWIIRIEPRRDGADPVTVSDSSRISTASASARDIPALSFRSKSSSASRLARNRARQASRFAGWSIPEIVRRLEHGPLFDQEPGHQDEILTAQLREGDVPLAETRFGLSVSEVFERATLELGQNSEVSALGIAH